MSMSMTHYMELLATQQPWNLIIYMAIPVILVETIAVTELLLLTKTTDAPYMRSINKWAGITAGVYFMGIFVALVFSAVIPLTLTGAWRGAADIIAVGSYLAGVVPLAGIALLEMGLIARTASAQKRTQLHAQCVAVFLIVAHIAMIFGMLDPQVLGFVPSQMPHGGSAHMMPM